MAALRNRKRQRADEPSQAGIDPPAKKNKTRSEVEREAWASWEYPPEFYDRLPNVHLSHRALKEVDRWSRARRNSPSPSSPASSSRRVLPHTKTSRELARFARTGGPDLSDIRGYPDPSMNSPHHVAMNASQSSHSRRTKSTDPASTLPSSTTTKTTKTTKTKKSSPYNRDFELHLTEHLIHPVYSSQKPDLEEVMAAMAIPRRSLSPSKFSDDAFEAFRASDERAKDEDDVQANVVPTILGPSQANLYCARNTVFANLAPLTDSTIAPPKPDIYYGAYPQQLSRSARNELAGHIIPSTMEDKPMAPNFFMEVKGPDGSAAVASRQARYDGAIGSRAIHSLQNYGKDEPQYDGQTYTFSSIYHNGQLQLYAHQPTAPTTQGGQPEYHMSRIKNYLMTETRETFVEGATAFRNVRDLAKRHRDSVILDANTKASQAETAAGQESPIQTHEDDTNSHQSTDRTDHLASQNADDELQRHIADASHHPFEEDSQEPSQESMALGPDDPSMSFAASFTSSFSTDPSYSKRPRQSPSPPSDPQGSHSAKSRTRPSAAIRAAGSSASAMGPSQPGASESRWVEAYWRKGKVRFRDPDGHEVETQLGDWTERTVNGTRCYYWTGLKSGRAFWVKELPKRGEEG